MASYWIRHEIGVVTVYYTNSNCKRPMDGSHALSARLAQLVISRAQGCSGPYKKDKRSDIRKADSESPYDSQIGELAFDFLSFLYL